MKIKLFFGLPKEIWVKIWSLVDFETLQKSCTVVCKDWRVSIRGNASLSDQMTLNNKQMSLEDINEVLSHWETLKIVRMSSEMSNDELLQLAPHPSLEKIIFPKNYQLGIWGEVTKVCFDLKNKSSEGNENIVELHLLDFFDDEGEGDFVVEEDISLEAMARMMLNLETLVVFRDFDGDWIPEKMKYFARFFQGLQHCKNLSELFLQTYFGDYVNYTPNIKKLEIRNCHMEMLDWIASLEKLEVLKLEWLRFEDKQTDIKEFTTKMFGNLTHLKILELDNCGLMCEPAFLMNIHEIIPSLETLRMTSRSDADWDAMFPMDIEYLVEVLESIGNVKNLLIEDDPYGAQFYLVNNKCFDRSLPNNLDEDQIEAIFHTALGIINKKFPIGSTSLEILDCKYGWSIKKEKEKSPTLTLLPFRCEKSDEENVGDYRICTEFFAEKAKLEEHVLNGHHRFPDTWL